jgi:hypothetical protein
MTLFLIQRIFLGPFLTSLLFLIMACSSSNPGTDSFNLPPVFISCNSVATLGCQVQNTGKDFYVGLSSNLNTDCELELYSLISKEQFPLAFDFHSNSKTTFSGEMEGSILQWYDVQNQPTFYMQNKNYVGCAFIDINSNGKIDPTEPYSQLLLTPDNNFPTFVDWKN